MDNKVKLEKFKVYDIDELINEGYKIARLSDNRDLKEGILKKKRASLKENGMLQPGIVINARLAVDQNLEISDFESGEIIKGNEIDNYLVLVDANHRYKAHRQLLKENEGKEDREQYHYKFFVMLPLQDEINIARMLAEMNICTKVWTGNDFIRNVNSPEEQTNVMEFMSELKKKNYSLPAISIYVSWSNKITSKLLYKVLRGDIPAILKDTDSSKSVIERSKKILDAASSFGDKFLKTRVFPNWLVNKFNAMENEQTPADWTNSMCGFLRSIQEDKVTEICKLKGKSGEESKEDKVIKMLDHLYEEYKQQAASSAA